MIIDLKIRDNINLSTTLSHSFMCSAWGGVVHRIVVVGFLDYRPLLFAQYWVLGVSIKYRDTKSLSLFSLLL